MDTFDHLILGGGVIGLSLARELAGAGRRVAIVERGKVGQGASWAGAGILPPASRSAADHPYDQLRVLSCELHPLWARQLREETGIDTGFRACGGLYLARSLGERAALRAWAECEASSGLRIEAIDREGLARIEPLLLPAWDVGGLRAAFWLPDECQLRNPRHVKALAASCRLRGVTLLENVSSCRFEIRGDRIEGLRVGERVLRAHRICVAAGAWTYGVLAQIGIETGILPIRGQIVLFRMETPFLQRIINEGSRYLVPREDGLVLAGSTEEEAGYDVSNTEEAIHDLTEFARSLVPALRAAVVQRTWAGLRPGSFDGLPYLGVVPPWENLYIAAGHFRSGITLSPGTAVVMAKLMEGADPPVDLAPFRLMRGGVRTPSAAACHPTSTS